MQPFDKPNLSPPAHNPTVEDAMATGTNLSPIPAITVEAVTPTPTPQPTIPAPDTISQIANQPSGQDITMNEVYAIICSQIIKDQAKIIGALSIEQASHINGLAVDPLTYNCVLSGDGNKVLEDLVNKYREFFGNAAVEVCREAASRYASRLPNGQMPDMLKAYQ